MKTYLNSPLMKKYLIALVCFSFLSTLNAQDSESYKSLDWSVGAHFHTPNSLGIYGTWEKKQLYLFIL